MDCSIDSWKDIRGRGHETILLKSFLKERRNLVLSFSDQLLFPLEIESPLPAL